MEKVIFRKPTTAENQAKALVMMRVMNAMFESKEIEERRKADPTFEIAFQIYVLARDQEIAELLGFKSGNDFEEYRKMGYNPFDLLESD